MYRTDGQSEKDCQSVEIIKLAVKFDEEKVTLIDARAGSVKLFMVINKPTIVQPTACDTACAIKTYYARNLQIL